MPDHRRTRSCLGGHSAMQGTRLGGKRRIPMSIRRSLALLAVPAATLALTATPAMASTARSAAPSGTEIIVANTAFGPSLAVGSGPFKNYTLYYITSDHGTSFGCTTGATSTPIGPLTCTGPSN